MKGSIFVLNMNDSCNIAPTIISNKLSFKHKIRERNLVRRRESREFGSSREGKKGEQQREVKKVTERNKYRERKTGERVGAV